MNKEIVKALYKKEITDILRDKKTILMMIVVPLVLYPLIFLGSFLLASSMATASTHNTYRIGFDNIENSAELSAFFNRVGAEYEYDFAYITPDLEISDWETALAEETVHAYLSATEEDGVVHYEIVYISSVADSATAASMLEDMLKEYREELRKNNLAANDLDENIFLYPITYEYEDRASNEETVGSLFGAILPFLLISSVLMGAMYPAIDITAGEKERGTLETLLTLPVKNMELITAKFLATSTIATAAAFLNVLSMGAMGAFFYGSITAGSETAVEFNVWSYLPAVGIMLLCAIVFAMFSSAVCLCVCIFAKSFKEAQNYTTPIMLVFMFAGMAGMIPGVALNEVTAFIPVVNISILITNLFQFKFETGMISLVLFTNIAYSILAVWFMTKIFDCEDILFGDGSMNIRLIEKRSDMKEKQLPGIGDVLLLFSVLLLVLLMLGSVLILKWGLWGLVAEQAIILFCTLFYAWYIKADFKRLFQAHRVNVWHLLFAVIVWAGTYLLMMVLSAILAIFFPESAEAADSISAMLENAPIWLIVFAMAFMPALCEEFAFRGFLFGTLKEKYRIPVAILWTGIIFGLFHMNLIKFFAVGLLGAVLAYTAYRSKSIWTCVMIHFVNNLSACLLTVYGSWFETHLPVLFSEQIGVAALLGLLLAGILLILFGFFLMKKVGGEKSAEREAKTGI